MKKYIIIFIVIVIAILSGLYGYLNFKQDGKNLAKENLEFEYCYNKEIYGTELATIINKAIENNEKHAVDRDDRGYYIGNEFNSIKIEIYMLDNETTYNMETFYMNDISRFVENYNNIQFKCNDIQYHDYTKRVKYMHFEQITQ